MIQYLQLRDLLAHLLLISLIIILFDLELLREVVVCWLMLMLVITFLLVTRLEHSHWVLMLEEVDAEMMIRCFGSVGIG